MTKVVLFASAVETGINVYVQLSVRVIEDIGALAVIQTLWLGTRSNIGLTLLTAEIWIAITAECRSAKFANSCIRAIRKTIGQIIGRYQ